MPVDILEKATIFNIMRYCVHDGPGIRTTVFFKGCPLLCQWCHNQESLEKKPQTTFNAGKCIKCGKCAYSAGKDNCPTGARETIGYEITTKELMREIIKDRLFYEQSGGGVTFSGGEPLYQSRFLLELLDECRENYINTAIDTSGFCGADTIQKAALKADCFLYDIKFMDSKKHEKYCGVSNEVILENLKNLAETRTKILLRIPVIPTVNDDMDEMKGIFEFAKNIKNIKAVHLLPYHNIQSEKYKKLGKQYKFTDIKNDESPNMGKIKSLFDAKFLAKVGG